MKALFNKIQKGFWLGILFSVPILGIAQPGTMHFTEDVSMRNNQLSHFYKMVTWDDTQYREFVYWVENASGGATEFMNFRAIFPPGYQQSGPEKYPMIVMLHGAGESGREWTGHYLYPPTDPRYDNNGHNLLWGGKEHRDAVNTASPDPRAFPGIVIFPQASHNAAWATTWDNGTLSANGRMAATIIEYMISSFNVDQHKIATHGLSNGAKGVWDLTTKRPDLFSAALPMSGVGSDLNAMTDVMVTTPLWQFQGGIDTNPSPGNTGNWISGLQAKGGSPRYNIYPGLGHGVWNTAYAEPDFFSWILQQDIRNIYVFGGSPIICTGGSVKLGIAAGFLAYQWTLNGVDISGDTTRFYTATQPGVYTVKFQRRTDGVWDESFPETLSLPGAGDAPLLSNTGSLNLPIQIGGSLDNIINMIAPPGYSQYKWFKDGILVATTTSNTRLVANGTGSNPALAGSYTVQVLYPSGCLSPASNALTITYTNPQPITPAFNILSRTATSSTSIVVTWQDVAGETAYEVWRYRKGDYLAGPPPTGYPLQKFSVVAFVPGNTATFSDDKVRPGASYIYRIRAVMANRAVVSNQPNPTFILPPADTAPPSVPSNLVATDITDTQVTLAWGESVDNDVTYEYEVFNGTTKLATIRTDTIDSDRTNGSPEPPTSFTATGLTVGESYTFNVRANDFKGNHSDFATLTVITGGEEPPETVYIQGLTYNYFEFVGSLTSVASFNFEQPVTSSGIVGNFDLAPRLHNDRFVFEYEGFIQIDNPGIYRFYTNSDEGSRLYINSVEVVNNDGLHTPATISGTYTFAFAGKHPIRLIYFEQVNGQILNVRYNPGTNNNYGQATMIPNSKLFYVSGGSGARMASPAISSPDQTEEAVKDFGDEKEVTVYPVPFNNEITIKFKNDVGVQQVSLFDLVGKTRVSTTVNSADKQVTVDYSDIPDGQYVLVVGNLRLRVLKKN